MSRIERLIFASTLFDIMRNLQLIINYSTSFNIFFSKTFANFNENRNIWLHLRKTEVKWQR